MHLTFKMNEKELEKICRRLESLPICSWHGEQDLQAELGDLRFTLSYRQGKKNCFVETGLDTRELAMEWMCDFSLALTDLRTNRIFESYCYRDSYPASQDNDISGNPRQFHPLVNLYRSLLRKRNQQQENENRTADMASKVRLSLLLGV